MPEMPMSIDLRERAADAYIKRKCGFQEVADRFGVSICSVRRWVAQKKQLGHLKPKKPSGRIPKIPEEKLPLLDKIIAKNNDKTLPELCAIWKHATGVTVSETVIRWAMKKLDYTRKKKQWSPKSRRAKGSKNCEIAFTVYKKN